jgi:menaquinol-cytochrome c reductase iron-sulfur subunit
VIAPDPSPATLAGGAAGGAEPGAGERSRTTRRSFFGVLLALGTACVGALLSVPLIRFALFPLLRSTTALKPSSLGPVSAFASLTTPLLTTIAIEQVDGWRQAISREDVYVTRDDHGALCVLSSICPHLGCNVPWVADKDAFICPCHGSVFAADGRRTSGPTLRGMDTLATTVQGGELLVRFQYFRQLIARKEAMS